MSKEEIFYKTLSVCSRCAIVDKAGLRWQPAIVKQRNNAVWLVVMCAKHAQSQVLLCSDVSFFRRSLRFRFDMFGDVTAQQQKDLSNGWEPDITDIEEIVGRLNYRSPYKHRPFLASIDLFVDGHYVSREDLDSAIEDFRELYGQGKKFVLKLNARLAMKLSILNDLVLFAARQMPGSLVLLECSFERLQLISRREDTALARSNVFPLLKIYVRSGEEQICRDQLLQTIAAMKSFKHMEMAVSINIDKPYPNMSEVFSILRAHPSLIRVVILENERSSSEMAPPPVPLSNEQIDVVGNADCMKVLNVILRDNPDLVADDFFPMSVCQLLEPFLQLLGFGNVTIRPSPFCGFVSCLLSVDGASVPVSRYVDVDSLYQKMLTQLDAGQGWLQSLNLARILRSCLKPGVTPPEFLSLLNREGQMKLREKSDHVQFLVFHNLMDIAAFDMSRRCNCGIVVKSNMTQSGFSAQCTNCML
eukprot:c4003_g1_i1.p1 GENE.c4003_g1_i1~~c4003_g1_i1.p1  ORF type:complete len:489 (+),score=109.96 c4003_g1_i1:48-1469(+)